MDAKEFMNANEKDRRGPKHDALSRKSGSYGSVFDLDRCPHCGGDTGFNYRLYLVGTQSKEWRAGRDRIAKSGKQGCTSDWIEDERMTRHGAYRCEDCGRIVRPNKEITCGA